MHTQANKRKQKNMNKDNHMTSLNNPQAQLQKHYFKKRTIPEGSHCLYIYIYIYIICFYLDANGISCALQSA